MNTKKILILITFFVFLIPLSAMAEVERSDVKHDGVEYKSITQWRIGYHEKAEAEARHFVYQGTSKKSLKLKLGGRWGTYEDQIILIDYSVNDGEIKRLQESPRFYLTNYQREMTLFLNEEAIAVFEKLGPEDNLVLEILTTSGEEFQIEIPPEILAEWLLIYHKNSY